ncbi:MAG: DUF2244 domain-containing protein [Magnetovibrio sp.]|nr:DUF2244 domain-containing protein [Magnetovibrio sp.]
MRTIDITEQDERGMQAFILTLRPRRSADPRVAYGLAAILGIIWFCAGAFIAYIGGWPVVGFFGAEFVVIAAMLNMFLRKIEILETVRITPRDVTITHKEMGVEQHITLPAYWARVHCDKVLEIRSHGEGVEIGSFLTPNDKNFTAAKLSTALRTFRDNFSDNQHPPTRKLL